MDIATNELTFTIFLIHPTLLRLYSIYRGDFHSIEVSVSKVIFVVCIQANHVFSSVLYLRHHHQRLAD